MTSTSKHAFTTELDLEKAIDAEADTWAKFFEVIGRDDEAEQIEGRKAVMRANVAVGYIDPLLPFLADRETGLTPRQLAERCKELETALLAVADEAKKANAVIALNRAGRGQGRVRVTTAMHRIERTARAAIAKTGGAA